MALLAAAVFGTDAEAAVRVYRPTEPSQVVLQLGSAVGESQLASCVRRASPHRAMSLPPSATSMH
jgi:hypothetical protein